MGEKKTCMHLHVNMAPDVEKFVTNLKPIIYCVQESRLVATLQTHLSLLTKLRCVALVADVLSEAQIFLGSAHRR